MCASPSKLERIKKGLGLKRQDNTGLPRRLQRRGTSDTSCRGAHQVEWADEHVTQSARKTTSDKAAGGGERTTTENKQEELVSSHETGNVPSVTTNVTSSAKNRCYQAPRRVPQSHTH